MVVQNHVPQGTEINLNKQEYEAYTDSPVIYFLTTYIGFRVIKVKRSNTET